MADILGLKRYMIPRFMAGLSAFGGLISDITREESAVFLTSTRRFEAAGVSDILARLKVSGEAFLEHAGVVPDLRRFEFSFLGRYEYQSWEIEVHFEADEARLDAEKLPGLVEAFHQMHERIYSIRSDRDVVEFTSWKLRAVGKRVNQDAWKDFRLADQATAPVAKAYRPVYLHEARRTSQLPVYDMDQLGAGAALDGPCLVEATTFTAFLKDKHRGASTRKATSS